MKKICRVSVQWSEWKLVWNQLRMQQDHLSAKTFDMKWSFGNNRSVFTADQITTAGFLSEDLSCSGFFFFSSYRKSTAVWATYGSLHVIATIYPHLWIFVSSCVAFHPHMALLLGCWRGNMIGSLISYLNTYISPVISLHDETVSLTKKKEKKWSMKTLFPWTMNVQSFHSKSYSKQEQSEHAWLHILCGRNTNLSAASG